ncbi:hypothetical protein Zmor_004038 [Zophobas morio]|uniref:DDE-1 domain-containing protein n=2 Tax=Zophobas morio TaxID=2755281 RepID=A0AA38HJX9_9CUCU|nr:hypothetical protein Zmor_004038 [Zophobas morio]
MEKGKESHVTLLDAFRFVDRAWNNVTQSTIQNCFKHAGFVEKVTSSEEQWLWDDEVPLSELCIFLNTEKINFQEFVEVDNFVWTSEMPTDDEIVDNAYKNHNPSQIETAESDDDEEAPPTEKISRLEARTCLRKLRSFLEATSCGEQSFTYLSNLENLIDVNVLNRKQMKITDYF